MKADPETRKALTNWLDAFSRAVVDRDYPRTMELFSSDADVSVWPSETDLISGRTQIEQFFESLYEQPFTITWTWQPVIVSTIGDAAWMAADSEEIYTLGDDERRYPYRVTAVFERDSNGWLCVHFHGSEPARHEEETAYSAT
ncbi:MAG: nuclear transport factor 2 family protein [Actinobacteria bacterium]|nr:nuclear transport factor 2 family protein [Actinomycetota bacterium]